MRSSHPSSEASKSATVGAISRLARAFRNRARVRRASTSSSVRAISGLVIAGVRECVSFDLKMSRIHGESALGFVRTVRGHFTEISPGCRIKEIILSLVNSRGIRALFILGIRSVLLFRQTGKRPDNRTERQTDDGLADFSHSLRAVVHCCGGIVPTTINAATKNGRTGRVCPLRFFAELSLTIFRQKH